MKDQGRAFVHTHCIETVFRTFRKTGGPFRTRAGTITSFNRLKKRCKLGESLLKYVNEESDAHSLFGIFSVPKFRNTWYSLAANVAVSSSEAPPCLIYVSMATTALVGANDLT